MSEKISPALAALDAQIQKLESMRERWEKGEGLDQKQMALRELTLELLEGAIRDLLKRRRELMPAQAQK